MSTQPEQAVGGVAAPEGDAAKPSVEDRFAVHAHAFEEELPEDVEVEGEPETDELDAPAAEGDDAELEVDEGEQAELPPIKAPASWTAEEQAEFAALPRHLQETVTRREAERERFVQAKAQEAARTRADVEAQALAEVQQLAQIQAERLQSLLPQIPEKPNAWLQVNDPETWAAQQEVYDWAVAQHLAVQQDIEQANLLAQTAEREHESRILAANVAILSEQFPDYLDATKGPEQRKLLGSIATELGFSAAELANPTARDILALRKVSEMKDKADKYDKLMAERMKHVRSGKQLPKVSRPGQAQGSEVISAKRLEADRHAMRSGDRDAALRVLGRHLAQ